MYVEYEAGEKFARNQHAETSDSLETFRDAGYILTDTDLVVDIDNLPKATIKKIISEFKINTEIVWTDRGAHLYFLKPDNWRRAKANTPLGVEVEYKHSGNTKSVTVKRNGIARATDNQGRRESLPNIFFSGKKYENLLGLDEGDGRNQKLYAHRMNIASLSNWKQIVEFINKHIFAEPLPVSELDVITRDVTVQAEKDGEAVVADLIMREKKVVKYAKSLWWLDGDHYNNEKDEFRRLVYRYTEGKPTRYVDEVIKQMDYRSKIIKDNATLPIKLKNGVLKDGTFVPVDYTDFTPYSIEIEYKSNAEPVKAVDDYLHHLTNGEPEYRKLILEMMAYTLITDMNMIKVLARFFILVGGGGNGKGTALDIINMILGDKNTSALDIDQLTDERYLNDLVGKLANLGDDVKDKPIDEKKMKILKNVATADKINVRKLYENASTMRLTSTLIFTSNHILKSFEKGKSFKRRVLWLPMYTEVKKADPTFLDSVTNERALEYWLCLMVEAYERLYKTRQFTKSKLVDDFNKQYHKENDDTLEFLDDLTFEQIEGKGLKEIYEQYEAWADTNSLNVLSSRALKSNIVDKFGLDTKLRKVNGVGMRIFQVIEEKGNSK